MNTNRENPWSVVDLNGRVISQSASAERAEDVKWEIENEQRDRYSGPLRIVNTIPWSKGP